MRSFQSFLAWSCAAFLVLTGVTAMFLFNIERKAFSAETFKQAFEKQGLYVRMPAILAEAIHTSIAQNENADPFLKIISVDEWLAGITNLLPPEDLRILADGTLDSLFAYLNNQSDSASISILPIKARLASPQGEEVIRLLINAQPECTIEQLTQMGLGLFLGDISLCKPPEEMMDLVTPMIQAQIQGLTVAIPDTLTLVSVENSNTQTDPRIQLERIRIVMKLSVLPPLFLLFLITLVAVRTISDWLKWWGAPLLITGVIALFASSIGAPILQVLVQEVIQRQGGSVLPAVLVPVIAETVGAVTGEIMQPVIIQGAVLGTIGFGMLVFAAIVRRYR